MSTQTTLGRASFFGSTNGQSLFRVNAGVSIEDALETASLLQFYANQLTLDAAMTEKSERYSWCALYLGEMAKALLDDVNDSLFVSRAEP
ncbi:hypothetical protein BS643_21425 [Pseudomonas protegens]|uniref:DUF3077 domain-containing protein n=1 Tax=Pseudomonas protegens TaxID=380021 RepID=UPI000806F951|nr:DUF3077 domain-containing protein [Pseudomonas protegens]OBZ19947.1 hypothetical protein BBH58_27160 [Pseudomonas protegens]OBZ21049.1 hypothetical protein BBH57_27195 [Pseudomonas protegens]OKK40316.1 hypothetical protein BS643_21425 [Pseudomonas protegens]OKK53089.1 hypothetical protein BS644_04440 [Pseudomonas protegens]OKK58581.1 hypothetical protein BS646_26055 [Pseudomonas protegens]